MKPASSSVRRSLTTGAVALIGALAALTCTSSNGAAFDSNIADPVALSVPSNMSREQYCAGGNYLGHYYNDYYGNHDDREFFYFQRNWLSACAR